MASGGVDTLGAILGGAAGGASTGSAFGPYGALIGGVAGGIMGGVKESKAQQAQNIPGSDPMELARLAELRRTVNQLQTGTDPLTRLDIKENQRASAAARTGIGRVTGGDVGSTISAFQKVQAAEQTGTNRAIAGAAQRIPYFDTAQGNLISRISQRKLELQLLNRAQQTAESAQSRTDANVSGNALLGAIGGGLYSGMFSGQTQQPEQTQVIPQSSLQTIGQPSMAPQGNLIENPAIGQVQGTTGYNWYGSL